MKQNPFSLYDFLGYLIPGAIFLYLLIYLIPGIPFFGKMCTAGNSSSLYLPFILFSYATGHLLSFLSSIFIENYSTYTNDFPSKHLFDDTPTAYFDIKNRPPNKCNEYGRIFGRFVLLIAILPVSLGDKIFGNILKLTGFYPRTLGEPLAKGLLSKCQNLLSEHEFYTDTDNALYLKDEIFRFLYHYAVEHSTNHLPKMQNYVALYGFARTISFLMVAIFWICLAKLQVNLGLCCGAIAYCFYVEFCKFYRRFSLEAIMACAVIDTRQQSDSPK